MPDPLALLTATALITALYGLLLFAWEVRDG